MIASRIVLLGFLSVAFGHLASCGSASGFSQRQSRPRVEESSSRNERPPASTENDSHALGKSSREPQGGEGAKESTVPGTEGVTFDSKTASGGNIPADELAPAGELLKTPGGTIGNSTTGSGMTGSSTTGSGTTGCSKLSPVEVKELCSQVGAKRLKKKFPITFANSTRNNACTWDRDQIEGVISGRREEKVLIELDPKAIMCDMKLGMAQTQAGMSEAQDFWFDDEVLLAFNGVILGASYNFYSDKTQSQSFDPQSSFLHYDWNQLKKERSYGHMKQPKYCIGSKPGEGDCYFPATEKDGAVFFPTLSEPLLNQLSAFSSDKNKFEMMFVTVGDNNPEVDCRHKRLEMSAEIEYVIRP
jgi:hypothetical protein